MNALNNIFSSIFVFFLFTQISAQITIDGTITDSDLNPISNALVEINFRKDYAIVDNEDSVMYNDLGTWMKGKRRVLFNTANRRSDDKTVIFITIARGCP